MLFLTGSSFPQSLGFSYKDPFGLVFVPALEIRIIEVALD